MRLTVLATGRLAGYISDQTFEVAGNPAVVFHNCLVEQDKGFGNGRAALHGQHAIRAKAQGFVEKAGQFGDFGVMFGWKRSNERHGKTVWPPKYDPPAGSGGVQFFLGYAWRPGLGLFMAKAI